MKIKIICLVEIILFLILLEDYPDLNENEFPKFLKMTDDFMRKINM